MKKILVLLALVLGFSATYAQTGFNAVVKSQPVTLKTTVIKPFLVSLDQQNGAAFADVIKGQNRTTFSADQKRLAIFKMTKEENKTVRLSLAFTKTNVDGLVLSAHWVFSDQYPKEEYTGFTISQNLFDWSNTQNEGWIGIILDGLNATNASLGHKTFTCNITGSYIGL